MNDKLKRPYYHGSPLKIKFLKKGSTITPVKKLAEVFSHKPTEVHINDDNKIKHNGEITGYLYQIDESIAEVDIHPHPNSTMKPDLEWITNRDLKLKLLEKTTIKADDKL